MQACTVEISVLPESAAKAKLADAVLSVRAPQHEHERQGVGRRLLADGEGHAIAERAQTLRMVVEQDNAPARGFHRRAGFVAVDTEVVERRLPTS